MGNSCKRCFGIHKTNIKYIRSDLAQSQDLSIEFENLMTNDYYDEVNASTQKGAPFSVTSYMKWLSDQERSFMEDDEDEPKDCIISSNYPQNVNTTIPHLIKENGSQANPKLRNWCTFGDEAELANGRHISDDQLTGYFLDELSRDLDISRGMLDPNKPMLYEEEEIDGPELARLIRKMRPRDLFLTGGSGDLLTTAHSSIFIGNSTATIDSENRHLNTLYSKIHQNLMKGVGDNQSAVTSDRDQSSIDLDWDHEPGMNPSLATVHRRSGTEEDLVSRLRGDEPNGRYSYPHLCTSKGHLSSQPGPHEPVLSHMPVARTTAQSPAASLMSPDQMFYNDELAWDLEGDLFSDHISDEGDPVLSSRGFGPAHCSSSTMVPSDRCHLLRD